MNLWLARHAQPLLEPGICYGATDVAADPQLTQQAAATLAQTLPLRVQVFSSPLQRCQQLAQCLQVLRPDLNVQTDARLAEMDFGRWEGRRWDAIAAAEMAQWTADFGHWRVGGGESVQQLMDRVASCWDELLTFSKGGAGAEAVKPDCPGVCWITHAGVMRSVALLSQGIRAPSHANQWPKSVLQFGEIQSLPVGVPVSTDLG